jgi:hypothetical protein
LKMLCYLRAYDIYYIEWRPNGNKRRGGYAHLDKYSPCLQKKEKKNSNFWRKKKPHSLFALFTKHINDM